jgi:hypothetical protein
VFILRKDQTRSWPVAQLRVGSAFVTGQALKGLLHRAEERRKRASRSSRFTPKTAKGPDFLGFFKETALTAGSGKLPRRSTARSRNRLLAGFTAILLAQIWACGVVAVKTVTFTVWARTGGLLASTAAEPAHVSTKCAWAGNRSIIQEAVLAFDPQGARAHRVVVRMG